MPDVKLSQLAAASPASVAAGAALWMMAGHILGLRMEYVGPASIRVSSGSAWVPSLQRAIEVPTALTLNGLTLAANTWYHLYLYPGEAAPAIEAVSIVPAAPYSGTARAKTGDTSRRYIGSFRTLASGAIAKFTHDLAASAITYLEDLNAAPFAVVAGGTATTATTVSCAAIVPITSKRAKLLANNNATGQIIFMSNSEAVNALSTSNWLVLILQLGSFYTEVPLDSSQAFNYLYSAAPSGGQAFIRAVGYAYER
ncbi:TPA: hypothetical protein ACOECM_001476 [Stenotrophomonas maltophilia]|nr:hypothetical protein [Stenotrophomonas maltophilia]